MNALYTTLKWPVISLLITGGVHFILEAIRPDLQGFFVPTVLAPILLSYGIWVGYNTIQGGGGFVDAIAASVILGLLPVALDVVGFGIILGRGVDVGTSAGIFGFAMVVFGALIGSGFTLGRQAPAAR